MSGRGQRIAAGGARGERKSGASPEAGCAAAKNTGPAWNRRTASCRCTPKGTAACSETQMVQWSGAPLSSRGCRWQTGNIMASSSRTMLTATVVELDRDGRRKCTLMDRRNPDAVYKSENITSQSLRRGGNGPECGCRGAWIGWRVQDGSRRQLARARGTTAESARLRLPAGTRPTRPRHCAWCS